MSQQTLTLDAATQQALATAQRNEATENLIYTRLAKLTRNAENAAILARIGADELRHYHYWKHYSGRDQAPDTAKANWYVFLARVLGLTFALKLMERGESAAEIAYERLSEIIPGARDISHEEDAHEHELIGMLDEDMLKYVGSVVLGLNDALVELTGALAGFTLALANVRLIGTTGLITGLAASMSMAASEYISTKSEGGSRNAGRAALYTGLAYVFTVIWLIFPYFVTSNYFVALAWTLFNALLVILFFTFYVSVAQDMPFRRRFLETVGISFGVAVLSFGIGFVVRQVFGIEI
ncbi:MAG: rubrerythrin family protein [Chloroflexi bacterium]|nr:rubrerythrin family protein [Chloroflexota bacterium]